MCQLYSWIEKDDKVVFLTADDVFKSKRGRALQKYDSCRDSWHGHGAIRWYYKFKGGRDKECTDFSTPDNFPPDLVAAILDGKMWGFGITDDMKAVLKAQAWAEYEKVEQPAWAEYEKVEQQALAEYKKVEQQASAEYEKVRQQASAEYEKVEQQALAEYEKVEQPAWAEYQKVRQQASAEYQKVRQPALAEYQKVEQPALAEYEKVEQQAWAVIWSDPKNRIPAWRLATPSVARPG